MKCFGGAQLPRNGPCPKCGARSSEPCPTQIVAEREAFLQMFAALNALVDADNAPLVMCDAHSVTLMDNVRAAITKAEPHA